MLRKFGLIFSSVLGAISCWRMAITFFRTWRAPLEVDNGQWVRFGMGIMALEFILVHSGTMLMAFTGSADQFDIRINGELVQDAARERIVKLAPWFLTFFYALFALTIALTTRSTGILEIFGLVMLYRWIGIFMDSEQDNAQQMRRSKISALLYLIIIPTTSLFPFPAGGITGEMLAQIYPHRGSGIWAAYPERVLWAGLLYFGALGLAELLIPWVPKKRV